MKRRQFFTGAALVAAAPFVRDIPLPEYLTCDDPRAAHVEVIDRSTGERVRLVKVVNVREGWLERYVTDEQGHIVLCRKDESTCVRWGRTEDGGSVPLLDWPEPVLERVTGDFELRRIS